MNFSTSTHLFKLVIRTLSKINLKEIGNQLSDMVFLKTTDDQLTVRIVSFDLALEYTLPIQNENKKEETLILPLQTLDAVVDTIVDSMVTIQKKIQTLKLKPTLVFQIF